MKSNYRVQQTPHTRILSGDQTNAAHHGGDTQKWSATKSIELSVVY